MVYFWVPGSFCAGTISSFMFEAQVRGEEGIGFDGMLSTVASTTSVGLCSTESASGRVKGQREIV